MQTQTIPSGSVGSFRARVDRHSLYPAHAIGGWRDAVGTAVRIRPIAPSDAESVREFVRSLSFESRYMRFMAAVKELSSEAVEQLTSIDHRRDAALIALVDDCGVERIVAVARYALNPDGQSCDFAIVVADESQRRGLGRRLLTLLVATATLRGLKQISGDVLPVNRRMLAFVEALGFSPSASDDPSLRHVQFRLIPPRDVRLM